MSAEPPQQIGFYWVRPGAFSGAAASEWQVALWNGEGWELIGTDELFDETMITEVDEWLRPRGEPE